MHNYINNVHLHQKIKEAIALFQEYEGDTKIRQRSDFIQKVLDGQIPSELSEIVSGVVKFIWSASGAFRKEVVFEVEWNPIKG